MKTALVLGGANTVWPDVGAALELFAPQMVVAVNDIGARWPGQVDIWASLHPSKMRDWRRDRARRGLPRALDHVGHELCAGIDRDRTYLWPEMNGSGSSGLFAVKLAIEAGAERIVLAGVPIARDAAHFFDPEPWRDRDAFTEAWTITLPRTCETVRSMSGWTKELLGAPTPEWLTGDPQL